ncbi:hypothetical protein [Halostella sp. PRR32]|uniref:hypothetical protein n=1 Tax=Halostella sp. PRR32 TaxID=3098147 RepID=UPI002B1D6203|nr:hypothetical protein [Halostella sp. PRR32]
MTDKHWPQDAGTGLSQQSDRDWADAAHIAAAAHDANGTDFVVTGLGLTNPDYTNLTIDVDSGMAKIAVTNLSSRDHGDGVTTTWDEASQVYSADARTGLALTDSDINEIWLDADQSSPDAVSVTVVDSSGSAPAAPALKIGEVDTTNDTTTQLNRDPDASFESVDAENVDIGGQDIQIALDGMVVPVGQGLGPEDAIDPANTTTPLQNATDAVAGTSHGYGSVLLPPAQITEDSPYNPSRGVSVIGWGRDASAIKFPSTGSSAHGIHMDASGSGAYAKFDGFRIIGPGNTNTTGVGWMVDGGNVGNVTIGAVGVNSWGNSAFRVSDPGSITAWEVGSWRSNFVTPEETGGTGTAVIDVQGGPANIWHSLYVIPKSGNTGADQTIITCQRGDHEFRQVNIGGAADAIAHQYGSASITIGNVNYEPSENNSTKGFLIDDTNENPMRVGSVEVNGAGNATDVNHVYRTNGGSRHAVFGPVQPVNGASLNTGVLRVNDTSVHAYLFAASGDVTNDSGGTLSPGITCFEDLTIVT